MIFIVPHYQCEIIDIGMSIYHSAKLYVIPSPGSFHTEAKDTHENKRFGNPE